MIVALFGAQPGAFLSRRAAGEVRYWRAGHEDRTDRPEDAALSQRSDDPPYVACGKELFRGSMMRTPPSRTRGRKGNRSAVRIGHALPKARVGRDQMVPRARHRIINLARAHKAFPTPTRSIGPPSRMNRRVARSRIERQQWFEYRPLPRRA
jgi:hypothetical protein